MEDIQAPVAQAEKEDIVHENGLTFETPIAIATKADSQCSDDVMHVTVSAATALLPRNTVSTVLRLLSRRFNLAIVQLFEPTPFFPPENNLNWFPHTYFVHRW